MKLTIKNLEITEQVKLEEVQVEVTSQDIKEHGLNIVTIIKELKPLIKPIIDNEYKSKN
jgi:hypothetical protein